MAHSRAASKLRFHKPVKYFEQSQHIAISPFKPMPCSFHVSTPSRHPPDGVSGAAWLVQWLIVLVVAFDFLSAPFHQHHHDGVTGQLDFATAHGSLDDGDTHADGDEHRSVSHATMAIRIDPSRVGQLRPIDNAEGRVALVAVAQCLVSVDELPTVQWRSDLARPDFRPHRSLPPAGRAPPLHA